MSGTVPLTARLKEEVIPTQHLNQKPKEKSSAVIARMKRGSLKAAAEEEKKRVVREQLQKERDHCIHDIGNEEIVSTGIVQGFLGYKFWLCKKIKCSSPGHLLFVLIFYCTSVVMCRQMLLIISSISLFFFQNQMN